MKLSTILALLPLALASPAHEKRGSYAELANARNDLLNALQQINAACGSVGSTVSGVSWEGAVAETFNKKREEFDTYCAGLVGVVGSMAAVIDSVASNYQATEDESASSWI